MISPCRLPSSEFWTVPRLWPGETVFIIGGGPSVRGQNIEALRGRRVIAINSSYLVAPWADYLIFADERWWAGDHRLPGGNRSDVLAKFKGEIVSACGTSVP